jgi:outer membrane protein insertion porin family
MRETAGANLARGGVARRMLRTSLVALFLALAMVSGPALRPAMAETYSFTSVVVDGNASVDAATVLSYAGISRGQTLSAGDLNDAYQRIVAAGLFEKVELVPQGNTLLIKVQEYPTINVIDFHGNKLIKDEVFTQFIKSKPRQVYTPAQAIADAAAITDAYRVQSRLAATVEPSIIRRSDNRVDLVFEITEGKVAENERISFVGNHAFSDTRLRNVLGSKQAGIFHQLVKSDTYSAERLEMDKTMLHDFYLSRGYIDAQIVDASAELSRERDATFLTFTINEGTSFKIGKITTVSELEGVNPADYIKAQRIRSGITYNPAVIDNNILRMENLALRQGLTFVRIEPRLTRNDRNQTLDVEFVISRGPKVFVERIDIEGNTTTLDQVVRRQFRTEEGDPFNPAEIRQAAERIRALGFFSDAQVNTKPGSAPDQVIVNVDVTEKPTGSIGLGLSYAVSSGVGVNLSFSETNFLGRGQGFDVQLAFGNSAVTSSFAFTEPALMGRDLQFSFAAFYDASNYSSSYYDTTDYGINTGLKFPVGIQSNLNVLLKMFDARIYNVSVDSSDILKQEEAYGSEGGLGLGYVYSFDNQLTGLSPDMRFKFVFGQDVIGIGDVNYLESNLQALFTDKVWNGNVTLLANLQGGSINAFGGYVTRVTDRYFANGKMKGFETNGIGPRDLTVPNQDALGGNFYVTANFEADFPIGLPEEYGIGGGVFYNVGSVWGLDNSTNVDDSFHLRSAIGVSLFWNTPIGPLRFDFTEALQKETYDLEQKFDLSIATSF